MKTDPAYVEGIARDRLQMGKPNETIVHFPSYQPKRARDQGRPPGAGRTIRIGNGSGVRKVPTLERRKLSVAERKRRRREVTDQTRSLFAG